MNELKTQPRTKQKQEQGETPTMVIEAPPNYIRTHDLAECPLCNGPNPVLDIHIPVREFGFFDICLYTCNTDCGCDWNPGREYAVDGSEIEKPHNHKFSVKHEILIDAQNLRIYDRTHFRDVW